MDVLQGTLDLLVLKALTWGPRHGYGVAQWIHEQTETALLVEDAALYQALHRLARKGLLEAQWGVSENNRRARFYALTTAGRRQLRQEVAQWRRYAEAVFKVVEA